jgi:hypothetical protein
MESTLRNRINAAAPKSGLFLQIPNKPAVAGPGNDFRQAGTIIIKFFVR